MFRGIVILLVLFAIMDLLFASLVYANIIDEDITTLQYVKIFAHALFMPWLGYLLYVNSSVGWRVSFLYFPLLALFTIIEAVVDGGEYSKKLYIGLTVLVLGMLLAHLNRESTRLVFQIKSEPRLAKFAIMAMLGIGSYCLLSIFFNVWISIVAVAVVIYVIGREISTCG